MRTAAVLRSVNPATEEVLAAFEEMHPSEVERCLTEASSAYAVWRRTPIEKRARVVRDLAGVLRARRGEYAELITSEMGKPVVEAEAEIEKCIATCEYFSEYGPELLADQPVELVGTRSFVAFQPIGVVLGVMPWNYPFWQAFRFIAPTLLAGNTVVLKHASNVPLCARAIQELAESGGLPSGVLKVALVGSWWVHRLIEDSRIAAVTLTGSTTAGSEVAGTCGQNIKKHVLELGGSDPFIVLEDADLDAAVTGAIRARFQNAGQSCVAAKRFIVSSTILESFVTRFVERVSALDVGNPLNRATQIGPLARPDLVATLEDQLNRSVATGAVVHTGGSRVDGRGWFFRPAVVTEVRPGMPLFDEEIFGPIAAVTVAQDDEEAISLANMTEFGLGASVWSGDRNRAELIARRIEAGSVFINARVSSQPQLPFGGVRKSGYGRELSSYGVREFTNVKSISIT